MDWKKQLPGLILFLHVLLICNYLGFAQVTQMATVYDFGAKGDSITDDTEAIRKAINSHTGQIIFPAGIYKITEPINIDLDKTGPVAICGNASVRIIMEGAGPVFRFIGTHTGTAYPSSLTQSVWDNQRMPSISGLEITGKNPKAEGIEAEGTIQLTITGVLIDKALHGIHLVGRNRNVIISECHIYYNYGIGIYIDDVDLHQINITNSHISYNKGGGIVVRNGNVHNLQIGSCDIEANMDEEGPPTANVFFDISEGVMLEGAITGCTVQHSHNAPGSANIRFIGHGTDERIRVGNFTIADNALSDTQYNIHIKYGRQIIITGNTFWKGFSNNILIEQSEHILLCNNMLDRNPNYKSVENTNSVIIRESNDLTITGMHIYNITGASAGLVLERCRNYNIMNSTILNCDEAGILLRETGNGKISGNFISDDRPEIVNPTAISVKGGKNNLVTTNYTNGIFDIDPLSGTNINNHTFTIK